MISTLYASIRFFRNAWYNDQYHHFRKRHLQGEVPTVEITDKFYELERVLESESPHGSVMGCGKQFCGSIENDS
ncbi:uncharacterized protein HBSAL_08580 [Halobacterium salinarum]|uniref:Uncharacterized protein n=3 Tax=Halobacterium salinarum TaxID=2242 RepID=A0A510N8T8_HALSA|nr:uncharacterized protein HBSAL_08580 [Halobacterium salinarum]DAC78632.1 TPA_inf: uncharacterized protein VNG_1649a [Halobacterium salinarum NRC-1]